MEVLSPPMELICGEAVILRDTGSGVSGLFWVDGDTHLEKWPAPGEVQAELPEYDEQGERGEGDVSARPPAL